MKKTVRLFSLFLALLMCVGILAACGKGKGSTTTYVTQSVTPGGNMTAEQWEALDFSSVTLRIAYNEVVGTTVEAAGTGNSYNYIKGPDDYADTAGRGEFAAAYERHARVCSALNLVQGQNFEYVMMGWDKTPDDTLKRIQAYTTANTNTTPNIVIHQNYGMVRGGILGHFYNALTTAVPENYFNLNHPNWYLSMMQENTIDTSKIYMLLGDYFIDQLRYAFGNLVNTEMAEDVLSAQGGLSYIYQLVYDGQWTYDTMMEIASLVGDSNTGSELIMGAVSDSWLIRNYFTSSGLDIYVRDPVTGDPSYTSDITDIHNWIDKLISMETEEYFSYNWAANATLNPSHTQPINTFMEGGALFCLNQLLLSLEGSNIRNMDSPAGILPNPKYVKTGEYPDESTDYRCLVSDNAGSGGILITSSHPQFAAASAFLQMMTEESDELIQEYFVEGLQNKSNSIGPDHIQMLNMIRNGLSSPMWMLYDNYCAKSVPGGENQTFGALVYPSLDTKTNTFAGLWNAQVGAKISRWNEIKADIRSRAN